MSRKAAVIAHRFLIKVQPCMTKRDDFRFKSSFNLAVFIYIYIKLGKGGAGVETRLREMDEICGFVDQI